MSSTRRSSSGEFHQERFCSAPEFEGDTINGLAAAKRIAIVKDRATREILLWLQWLSLSPGALQTLCEELIATFPDRIGTPTLRKLQSSRNRELRESEARAIQEESEGRVATKEEDWSSIFSTRDDKPHQESRLLHISEITASISERLQELHERLVRFCLDPNEDIAKGVWYFEDLLGALTTLRTSSIAAARARLADTDITRKIIDALDFWYARGRTNNPDDRCGIVIIEGVAGIGRSYTTKVWRDEHAGMVRYLEVPSSSDDRSFYVSIARQLGVACGASYKAQQIKVRIEEVLLTSELRLVLDEAQYLWGQAMRPRKTPDRLLWIKSVFDAGTPVALIAHTDFSKWQKLFVDRTLWTDEQFERRLNRHVFLPTEHSKEDMLKIARARFPAGDSRSWKLLAAYSLGTEKKQASGVKEALQSARYRAEKAGRAEPTFADIEAALIHDHHFLSAKPGDAAQPPSNTTAEPLQTRCNSSAQPRLAGEADSPIRIRPQDGRIKIHHTMKMPKSEKPTPADLKRLLRAADRARARVSGYSDEKRAELEAHARGQVHHGKPETLCGTRH